MKKLYRVSFKVNGKGQVRHIVAESEESAKNEVISYNPIAEIKELEVKEVDVNKSLNFVQKRIEEIRKSIELRMMTISKLQATLTEYDYYSKRQSKNKDLKLIRIAIAEIPRVKEKYMVKTKDEAIASFYLQHPEVCTNSQELMVEELIIKYQRETIKKLISNTIKRNKGETKLLNSYKRGELRLLKNKKEIEENN